MSKSLITTLALVFLSLASARASAQPNSYLVLSETGSAGLPEHRADATEHRSERTAALVVAGFGASAWLASFTYGIVAWEYNIADAVAGSLPWSWCTDSSGENCKEQRQPNPYFDSMEWLMLPIAGPWIALAEGPRDPSRVAVLVTDGLLQAGGLVAGLWVALSGDDGVVYQDKAQLQLLTAGVGAPGADIGAHAAFRF